MAGPAPTELIQRTEDDTRALHANVGKELGVINQPPETVPEHEKPALSEDLRKSMEDALYVAGSTAKEAVSGKEPGTDIRVTSGKRPGRWVLDRIRRLIKK